MTCSSERVTEGRLERLERLTTGIATLVDYLPGGNVKIDTESQQDPDPSRVRSTLSVGIPFGLQRWVAGHHANLCRV